MSDALSRHELNRAFLDALKADFSQHGPDIIKAVRLSDPDKYLALVAKLLPKEISISVTTSPLEYLTPEQLNDLSSRLAGCEKFLEHHQGEIDALELPGLVQPVYQDIID